MSTIPYPDFALIVRTARDGMNLSQREFADLIGVSERTVQGWEYGVVPQPRHRRRLVEVLNEQVRG